MKKLIFASAVTVALGMTPAFAQTTAPTTPSTATSGSMDAATEAKFKTADRDSNGTLEGAELDAHKAVMTQVDTNKDGKISQAEFVAASKAGHIK